MNLHVITESASHSLASATVQVLTRALLVADISDKPEPITVIEVLSIVLILIGFVLYPRFRSIENISETEPDLRPRVIRMGIDADIPAAI